MRKEHLEVFDLWLFKYTWEPPNVAENMGFCLKLHQGLYYPSANSKGSGDNIYNESFFMGWLRLYFINVPLFQNQTELTSLCICYNMEQNASSCYKTTIFGKLFDIISFYSVWTLILGTHKNHLDAAVLGIIQKLCKNTVIIICDWSEHTFR